MELLNPGFACRESLCPSNGWTWLMGR